MSFLKYAEKTLSKDSQLNAFNVAWWVVLYGLVTYALIAIGLANFVSYVLAIPVSILVVYTGSKVFNRLYTGVSGIDDEDLTIADLRSLKPRDIPLLAKFVKREMDKANCLVSQVVDKVVYNPTADQGVVEFHQMVQSGKLEATSRLAIYLYDTGLDGKASWDAAKEAVSLIASKEIEHT